MYNNTTYTSLYPEEISVVQKAVESLGGVKTVLEPCVVFELSWLMVGAAVTS